MNDTLEGAFFMKHRVVCKC